MVIEELKVLEIFGNTEELQMVEIFGTYSIKSWLSYPNILSSWLAVKLRTCYVTLHSPAYFPPPGKSIAGRGVCDR